MNLETWVKYSGELPTASSIWFIIIFSIVFGIIATYVLGNLTGILVGVGFGISGFLLVILPNLLFIIKMMNDEKETANQ